MKVTSAMLFMAVVGSSVGMLLRDAQTEDRHERQVAVVDTDTAAANRASAASVPQTAPVSQAAPVPATQPAPATAATTQTVRTVGAQPAAPAPSANATAAPSAAPDTQTTDLAANTTTVVQTTGQPPLGTLPDPNAQIKVEPAAASAKPQSVAALQPGNPVPVGDPQAPGQETVVVVKPQSSEPKINPADVTDDQLELMIGQLLILGFDGNEAGQPAPKRIAKHLAAGRLGGVVFFGRNIKSAKAVQGLTGMFLSEGLKSGHVPLIAIDQEGGEVQRLHSKHGVDDVPPASDIAKEGPKAALSVYSAMARSLKEFGFNLNFGPVVDVNINPANPIIGARGRSFSTNPDVVTEFAAAFILAHADQGILTSVKHFPGHGSSTRDSHKGQVDISKTWKVKEELKPYKELIKTGMVDMIMTGHLNLNMYSSPDDPRPASLSPMLINELLRSPDQLGYQGVVITDDLEMKAVRNKWTFEERLIMALKAGNDILLNANSIGFEADLSEKAIKYLVSAARDDSVLLNRIIQSYTRVITLKQRLVGVGGGVAEIGG